MFAPACSDAQSTGSLPTTTSAAAVSTVATAAAAVTATAATGRIARKPLQIVVVHRSFSSAVGAFGGVTKHPSAGRLSNNNNNNSGSGSGNNDDFFRRRRSSSSGSTVNSDSAQLRRNSHHPNPSRSQAQVLSSQGSAREWPDVPLLCDSASVVSGDFEAGGWPRMAEAAAAAEVEAAAECGPGSASEQGHLRGVETSYDDEESATMLLSASREVLREDPFGERMITTTAAPPAAAGGGEQPFTGGVAMFRPPALRV